MMYVRNRWMMAAPSACRIARMAARRSLIMFSNCRISPRRPATPSQEGRRNRYVFPCHHHRCTPFSCLFRIIQKIPFKRKKGPRSLHGGRMVLASYEETRSLIELSYYYYAPDQERCQALLFSCKGRVIQQIKACGQLSHENRKSPTRLLHSKSP